MRKSRDTKPTTNLHTLEPASPGTTRFAGQQPRDNGTFDPSKVLRREKSSERQSHDRSYISVARSDVSRQRQQKQRSAQSPCSPTTKGPSKSSSVFSSVRRNITNAVRSFRSPSHFRRSPGTEPFNCSLCVCRGCRTYTAVSAPVSFPCKWEDTSPVPSVSSGRQPK